jgi:hypothetical protein
VPDAALTKIGGVGTSIASKISSSGGRHGRGRGRVPGEDPAGRPGDREGARHRPEAGTAAQPRSRAYDYYAVTDHAPNLVMQQMTDEKMLAQCAELNELDSRGMTLLHGAELNIASDGSVDWDADFLAGFDMCVASVQTENPNPKRVNLRAPPAPLTALAQRIVCRLPRLVPVGVRMEIVSVRDSSQNAPHRWPADRRSAQSSSRHNEYPRILSARPCSNCG